MASLSSRLFVGLCILLSILPGLAVGKCVPNGVHIFGVRGNASEGPPYGLLKPTVMHVQNRVGKGSNNEPIPYPKTYSGGAQGELNLVKRVKAYVKQCPDTPIVILAYSRGGVITMDTLCNPITSSPSHMPHAFIKNIIAIALYGEETRAPHEPYNRGSCKGGYGVSRRQNSKPCLYWKHQIHSYCDKKDALCCLPRGHSRSVHDQYPQKYDRFVVPFVKAKFQKYMKAHGKRDLQTEVAEIEERGANIEDVYDVDWIDV